MPLARADARDRTAQVKRVLIGLLVANIGVVGAKFVIVRNAVPHPAIVVHVRPC